MGLDSVGATFTLDVKVVVNTFDSAQLTVIVVEEYVTTTGVVAVPTPNAGAAAPADTTTCPAVPAAVYACAVPVP
jgi:hypothetical protein